MIEKGEINDQIQFALAQFNHNQGRFGTTRNIFQMG